jgi:hypothetical protein
MPYETSWLVEKRVIYTRMYGFVSGEELKTQNEEMVAFIEQSEQLLHTISDATDTTGTDMGLRDLQQTQFTNVDNLGWAVYISPSKMNRFFASVITQLSKKRGRQFATLEEGLRFLQEMDETLPPLSVPEPSNVTQNKVAF